MKNIASFASTVTACAAALVLGSGTAGADGVPDVVGKQYGEAKGMLFSNNLRPVVSTVIGDRVPQDQCFVTSTSKLTSRDASGRATTNQVQVNLSCYARPSDKTTPGFSAGNFGPDAQAVRADYAAATKKWKQSADGQKWCEETAAAHPEWGPLEDCAIEK